MRLLILCILLVASVARAANPAFGDFNANQFDTTGNKVAIKSGVVITNITGSGTNLTIGLDDGAAATPALYFSDVVGDRNTGFYRPGTDSIGITIDGTIYWRFGDGAGGGHFLAPQDNTVDIGTPTLQRPRNIYAAGNIYATNGTLSGAGFQMTTSPGAGKVLTSDAAGIASWQTPSSGGSGVTEAVTTLAWSTTNITGFDCATNANSFFLLVTNNCFFGAGTFSNLPAKTAYRTYTLCLQQDSTGGYAVNFTNSIVLWSEQVQAVVTTNAGAVSYIYLHTGLATNSTLVGSINPNIK